MLLNYLAGDWLVQLGFIAAIAVVILAIIFKNGSEKAQELGIAATKDAQAHEVDMWRVKQGVIEHKKWGLSP